ncbi:hypothetical protein DY124_06435 [Apilactobacillus micheneri]|uniref:ATP-binding protein n=1 Tax=Apilactobacillus micheneri TaxID=1899430 RepID=UPI001126F0E2|nr:AAA family ATPase [Apilactobacillus micheneri]TPR43048.1 hypothetical protein DY124_06435 [Apilactobacillus micheneri]TPR47340.1 hypothetical protein DY125_06095 [Apilactobacillus micheneri]
MKINQIKVYGYGKWQNQIFNLNKNNLQIVYGNNESGKTTLLSLIMGILFGYKDGRGNSYEQYIPKETNSYGGSLSITTDDNRNFLVKRISGTYGGKLSIYDLDNECETDSNILSNILGPIDREVFEHIFYFGDLNIKDISRLNNNELIERIQKVGFVGSNEWIAINDKLDKDARALYAPNGRKPPLNKKLKDYEKLLTKINDSRGNLNEYENYLYNNQLANKKVEHFNNQIKDLDNKIYKLNNHKNNWSLYEQLNNHQNLNLRPGFDDASKNILFSIKNNIKLNNKQIEIINNQINDAKNKVNQSDQLNFYEQNENKIDNLYNLSSSINDLVTSFNTKKQLINDYQIKQETFINEHNVELSVDDKDNITRLNNFKDNRGSGNLINTIKLVLMFLGIILVVILPGILKIVGLVLASLALCSYIMKYNQLNNFNKKIKFYKEKYGFSSNDPQQWLLKDSNINDNFQDDINKHKNELFEIQKKINDYFDSWHFAEKYIKLDDNYGKNMSKIYDFVKKNRKAINENNGLTKIINKYLFQKNELVNKKEKLKNQLINFLEQRNISTSNKFNDEFNKQQAIIQENNRQADIKDQLGENEIKLLKQFKSKTEIENKLNEHKNLQLKIKQQMLEKSKSIEKNNLNIQRLTSDGTYQDLEQKKANLETEINGMVDDWLTMKLSGQWIDKALNIATADRIPMFQEKANEYFGLLTNHNYIKITYYKSKLKVTRKDKLQFDAGELSRGTIEQLYLSLILSLAVVFGRDYKIPIIIDDGFNEFDFDRSYNAYKLLDKISESLQIIYVTCNKSVFDYYNLDNVINLNYK